MFVHPPSGDNCAPNLARLENPGATNLLFMSEPILHSNGVIFDYGQSIENYVLTADETPLMNFFESA
jgi:hypothetical protein